MRNLRISILSTIIGTVTLSACSTSQVATTPGFDNAYFMASDALISNDYAIPNNNPESFTALETLESAPEENFSSRNVNPDYLAKYSTQDPELGDDVVYFDEGENQNPTNGNIDAYNNFRVNNNGNAFNQGFNSGLAFGTGFMTGFSPWGMGFMDPFWNPGWGFRPGFSVNIGFGWGSPFWGGGFGFGRPFFRRGWGMGGFYDPFWDPFWGPSMAWGRPGFGFGGWGQPGFGFGGWGQPGFGFGGWNGIYAGRPTYVLPGGEYGDRRLVRGARPTRGAGLSSSSRDARSAVLPNTTRAQARRSALSSNRSLVSSDRSRIPASDFSRSQSDLQNSNRSRVISNPSGRNTRSAAMDRTSSTRTRSAMPSARPITSRTTRTDVGRTPSRSSNYNRSRSGYGSSSPSYNRQASPSRTSPSYNNSRGTSRTYTPSRSSSPSRMSTPSRSSSSPSRMSSPSRSSGSSGGGVSRGGGSSSRGGRGN